MRPDLHTWMNSGAPSGACYKRRCQSYGNENARYYVILFRKRRTQL